jgi:hypothetical protein
LAAVALGTVPACSLMPWSNNDMIVDSDPSIPPIAAEAANDRHLIVMRVPTGGWTLSVDKDEVIPAGRRVYVTARRPDPAFMHTQAFVNLRALTDVPVSTDIEVVARVLDRHAKPNSDVYARVDPAASIEQLGSDN